MTIEEFISNFREQFDDTNAGEFHADTKFKELDEWSSMVALTVIAMIDAEYDVQIKGEDIRESETIFALFERVKSKKE